MEKALHFKTATRGAGTGWWPPIQTSRKVQPAVSRSGNLWIPRNGFRMATFASGSMGAAPDHYSFTVGDVKVTALSDGTVPQNLHDLLRNTTNGKTDALLERSFLSNPVEASINAFLFQIGDRLVLVDTEQESSSVRVSVTSLSQALLLSGLLPNRSPTFF